MKNILWDLDGTLTDPKVGIVRCIQYALTEFGKPAPHESDLLWCIGPPLQNSFRKLVPDSTEIEAWKLVEKYRERFSKFGLYENSVYPGIQKCLRSLTNRRNFVATSKPRLYASKIVEYFNLSQLFFKVYGSELDGTLSDKADLIKFILLSENIDSSDAFMIGDRKHDIIGAKAVGVKSIAVTWGYGDLQELEDAGADYIFNDPADLEKFLVR